MHAHMKFVEKFSQSSRLSSIFDSWYKPVCSEALLSLIQQTRAKIKKQKVVYSCLWETNHRATERHIAYAIWDHTVLPATRHRWTRPAL